MKRRTRLFIRQALAHRRPNAAWHVGYWDQQSSDPDRDFRVVLSRPTAEEAEAAAKEYVSRHKKEFFI